MSIKKYLSETDRRELGARFPCLREAFALAGPRDRIRFNHAASVATGSLHFTICHEDGGKTPIEIQHEHKSLN